MNGKPINAASYAAQTDADAISNYIGGTPVLRRRGQRTKPASEHTGRHGCNGNTHRPDCDDRMGPSATANATHFHARPAEKYAIAPTTDQLTAHLQAAVDYVASHPAQCPSKAILIYSWDECDEGGNAIIPTYTGGAPDTSRITALQGVTW